MFVNQIFVLSFFRYFFYHNLLVHFYVTTTQAGYKAVSKLKYKFLALKLKTIRKTYIRTADNRN